MKQKKIRFPLYSFLIVFFTLIMGVGYASVNGVSLDIEGTSVAIEQKNIFITDAHLVDSIGVDMTLSKVETAYQTMFHSNVVLSSSNPDSSVTFEITVYNSSNEEYFFKGTNFDDKFYNNADITFDLSGISVGTLLSGKEFLTFNITFHYNNGIATSNELSSYINFEFVRNTFADIVIASNALSDDCPVEVSNNLYLTKDIEKESRFCRAKDNYGDTYYFRGASDNNYVSFAGSTWRIMRVNGNGSVRLLYEGDIGSVDFSQDPKSDNAYIGYMYGSPSKTSYEDTHTNSSDSIIKKVLDSWYENNILNKYDDYIDDMYFYNDRSTTKSIPYYSQIVSLPVHYSPVGGGDYGVDTGLGYGTNVTYYGTWIRLVDNVEKYYSNNIGSPDSYPTFYCSTANDCYTSNSQMYGVNVLKYPIATITMDDAVFAGAGYKENSANDSTYIYNGTRFQLNAFPLYTPRNSVTIPVCSMMGIHSLGNGWITCGSRGNFAVRPVINVKGDLVVSSGNGTKTSPYILGIREENDSDDSEENVDKVIEEEIMAMSLEEKVGQMIIVSASGHGTSLNSSFSNIIKTVRPGGIIIMTDNVNSKTQLMNFMNEINSLINEYSNFPLIWGVDQEGGRVQRLSSNIGATVIPSMYDLGSTGNVDLAHDVGKVVGEELKVFGFNLDFAPVADIWSNPNNTVIGKRAFGNDFKTVSEMSLSFANGLESAGVMPVYKHFPGHGDTLADSHVSLPIINKAKNELLENEIIPFKNAIDNGAEVIMVGHLSVPALTGDTTTPTSLSKKTITDFLRGELGFDGVVVTDGLNMAALDGYSKEDLYTTALNAGVNLLLGPTDPVEALNVICDKVRNGYISEEIVNQSVYKILKLKYKMNMGKLDESYLGSQEHKDIISRIPISN